MTEWMRDQNNGVNAEDYLLGKAVGKEFEQQGHLGQINAVEYDCAPESIFSSRADHQVDLQRKLQEDPLVALRKQEIDSKKRLLDNPVKMKEIQAHLDKMRKKDKKKKKKKKHKKSRGSDSEGGDSPNEADLDALLLQKLGHGPAKSRSRSRTPPPKSPSVTPPRRQREERSNNRDRDNSNRKPRNRSPPRRQRSRSRSPYRRKRSRSPYRRRSRSPRRRRSRSPRERAGSSRSNHNDRKGSKQLEIDEDKKAQERLKKLAEMTQNAKWAEKKQKARYDQYKKEEEAEAKELNERRDPDFLNRELARAAASESVEKRIQSNKYKIQRGGASMDKNFARK